MVITTILTILYYALYALLTPLRILPDAVLPDGISNAMGEAGHYLASVNVIVPVDTLLIILGAFITIEAGIFLYKTIMWLVKKIPTIN